MAEYSSILLENAVESLSKLPGIGKKTALRLALHLLNEDNSLFTAERLDTVRIGVKCSDGNQLHRGNIRGEFLTKRKNTLFFCRTGKKDTLIRSA